MPSWTSTKGLSKYASKPPRPRLTKEKLHDIERDIRLGITMSDIARTYGISRSAIHQTVTRYNLAPETRGRRLCAYCSQWIPTPEITAHRKSNHPEREYLNAQPGGGTVSIHPGMSLESSILDEMVAEDYRAGIRLEEISRKYRVGDKPRAFPEIYRRLKRQGITPNRGGGRYERTPEIREKIRQAQYKRHTDGPRQQPRRGWRADG